MAIRDSEGMNFRLFKTRTIISEKNKNLLPASLPRSYKKFVFGDCEYLSSFLNRINDFKAEILNPIYHLFVFPPESTECRYKFR